MMRIWIALIEKVNNFKNIIHAKKEVWNVKWLNYQKDVPYVFENQ